jgi:alanyl-tRNA synthetase
MLGNWSFGDYFKVRQCFVYLFFSVCDCCVGSIYFRYQFNVCCSMQWV